VAVDLTAWCARNEPDLYMRQAYEFALLEDFDHLYRYANMLDMQRGDMRPEQIVGQLTEITPGRPTISEHRHPIDSIRKPMDISSAAPITMMNVMTLVAAEQQTMNYYMNVANRVEDPILRGLYTEIGMIEEQHVSHYESLMDGRCSWLMCAVMHEYHECYLYNAFMAQEVDPRVKKIWEIHLDMEIGHLQDAVALYKKHEGEDPSEFLPPGMPAPLTFESNIPYLREVLADQVRLTADGTTFVPVDSLPRTHRYFAYRDKVNGVMVPTQQVIRERIAKKGEDYRFETAPHPVPRFQDRKVVPEY
jgi:rubrerythrin